MKKITTLLITLTLVAAPLFSQVGGMEALRADYPMLMEKFGKELEGQRADYIFAIDVSGTMGRFKETVVPALGEFFRSLQQGDYVSIIKFGGEAVNEVGSAGKVSAETIANLIDYAGHIYDTPTTAYEKEKYFKWTDLDNMLHYLADDMKQIDRSRLKFVFIITDFLHDPSAARRGREDWDGVARRFATEQAGNDVYVFALQLPGSGRDLERVRSVFPKRFGFSHVPIANGKALSDWFTQRKNAILLDKFYALVAGKIEPDGFSIAPSMDVDGNLDIKVSWRPNPVYDVLRVDSVGSTAEGYEFKSKLPKNANEEEVKLAAGKFRHQGNSVLCPSFRKFAGDVIAEASFDVPYEAELGKLGFAAPTMRAAAPVSRTVFCYPLPLWLCCLIAVLVILYIMMVIQAFLRNRSDFYRINGKFEVSKEGTPVTEKKKANNLDKVDLGKGASFLAVPDSDWAIRIDVRRYNPFVRPMKHPDYVATLTKGSSFKSGVKYGIHQHPVIARHAPITIEKYKIRWIK